jgi:hypothetical protein
MKINKLILCLMIFLMGCSSVPNHLKTPQQRQQEEDLKTLGEALLGIGIIALVAQEFKKNKNFSSPIISDPLYTQCSLTENFQGCCSWHQGVTGCYNYRVICNDGTVSPSCMCTVPYCVR